MKRIALVVSDVDGTLLTKDKRLTEAAKDAVRRLHAAGIGFTITSSRPTIGMRFLIEPLQIKLPIGAFNGSSIADSSLQPIEQHLIPEGAARRCIDLLNQFGTDTWLFTGDRWLARDDSGQYVALEKRAIQADPTVVADFTPYLASACKIVGSSADAELLKRCEIDMKMQWAPRRRRCVRRAITSTSPRPAATRAPLSRQWQDACSFQPALSPPSETCKTICRCSPQADFRLPWAMLPMTSKKRRPTLRPPTKKRVLPRRWR